MDFETLAPGTSADKAARDARATMESAAQKAEIAAFAFAREAARRTAAAEVDRRAGDKRGETEHRLVADEATERAGRYLVQSAALLDVLLSMPKG